VAQFFDSITDKMAAFIEEQPMFCVATACSTGRVNLSPKGMDTFRVLGPNLCGYVDLTGSGNETAAHITNDGRITFMFNSFSRTALILRLYGKGRTVRPHHADFATLSASFPDLHGRRQIILMDVESTQESCGYAVPQMELVAERETHTKYVAKQTREEIEEKQKSRNHVSIDGFATGLND